MWEIFTPLKNIFLILKLSISLIFKVLYKSSKKWNEWRAGVWAQRPRFWFVGLARACTDDSCPRWLWYKASRAHIWTNTDITQWRLIAIHVCCEALTDRASAGAIFSASDALRSCRTPSSACRACSSPPHNELPLLVLKMWICLCMFSSWVFFSPPDFETKMKGLNLIHICPHHS